ncbi:MAG: hypothetical protein HFG20_11030 [Anaerotruncus sp.]|nr:hypothetical protein [Anaerotruncus sp.]
MFHPDLLVDGYAITDPKKLKPFFQKEHFCCRIGEEFALDVEFSKERAAFFGWFHWDEEIYYFDNGSGNRKVVDLLINCCPQERLMCYDPEVIQNIVVYFCETGQRNPAYNWIADDFDGMEHI